MQGLFLFNFANIQNEPKIQMEMADSKSNTIFSLIAGIAIGVGLGLLFAPEKGEETRRKIKEKVKKEKEQFLTDYDDVIQDVKSKFSSEKEVLSKKMDEFMAKGNEKRDELIDLLEKKLEKLKSNKEAHS